MVEGGAVGGAAVEQLTTGQTFSPALDVGLAPSPKRRKRRNELDGSANDNDDDDNDDDDDDDTVYEDGTRRRGIPSVKIQI